MLVLDGNGDYVDIEDSPSLDINGSVTLEAWVYPLEVRGWRQIIAKGDTAFCEDPYYLRMEADSEIKIEFGFWQPKIPDSIDLIESRVTPQVVMRKWIHIAGVLDVENHTMNLYLNGELLESKATEGSTGTDRAMPINIGAMTDGSQFFKGFIDELRIWSVARTQEDIQSTMKEFLTGNEDGLVGYWNFDDGTANDLTPNGNNGTLMEDAQVGMACFVAEPRIGGTPLTLQFTPITRASHIDSYLWDFGDGNTSDKPNPTPAGGEASFHTYQHEEPYTVSLTATANGETDTITYDIFDERRNFDLSPVITLLPDKHAMKDKLQLELYRAKFVDAAHLKDIVSDFLTEAGLIRADPRTNYLIVMDVPIGMERAFTIIKTLDIPVEGEIIMERLNHRDDKRDTVTGKVIEANAEYVTIKEFESGKTIRVHVPVRETETDKPFLDERLSEMAASLQAGDGVKIAFVADDDTLWIEEIKPLEAEDER